MRKIFLRIYLWFNDVSLCGHPASGLRYCPECEARKKVARSMARYEHAERLKRLQAELFQ